MLEIVFGMAAAYQSTDKGTILTFQDGQRWIISRSGEPDILGDDLREAVKERRPIFLYVDNTAQMVRFITISQRMRIAKVEKDPSTDDLMVQFIPSPMLLRVPPDSLSRQQIEATVKGRPLPFDAFIAIDHAKRELIGLIPAQNPD